MPSLVSLKVVLLIGPYWRDEQVVGPVEVAAGLFAMLLGPALVLGLQHPAGMVAEVHQGGKPLAGHRAVGSSAGCRRR